MLINLLLGLPTMLVSLFLQLLLLLLAVRYYRNHVHEIESPSLWSSLVVSAGVMLLLVIGNLMQIAFWSGLFVYLKEFDTFNTAFYHSMVNFASLGYGDIVMSEKHRRCQPWRAKRRLVVPSSCEAALLTRRAHSARGEAK